LGWGIGESFQARVRRRDVVEVGAEPSEQGSSKAKMRDQPRLAGGEGAQVRDPDSK
jgi:hypothetical protein